MDKLIFLDTETTGNNQFNDRLFEVAYKFQGKTYCEYFKPPIPISVKSSSITHVTNEMVADKPPFENSHMKKELKKILPDNILVAHSADFDIDMLSREEVYASDFICTMKVARFLDEDGEIPEYGLQYLRYHLKLNVKDAYAHDAKSDIKVLEALFYHLFEKMKLATGKSDEEILNEMKRVSKEPILFKTITFGKHRGKLLSELAMADRGYLEWLLEQKMMSDYDEENWIYSLKYYLQVKD